MLLLHSWLMRLYFFPSQYRIVLIHSVRNAKIVGSTPTKSIFFFGLFNYIFFYFFFLVNVKKKIVIKTNNEFLYLSRGQRAIFVAF